MARLVERNSYIQPSQNKTDLRVQQRVPLGGRLAIDLIGEVFNVFNRPNFTETVRRAARITASRRPVSTAPARSGSA